MKKGWKIALISVGSLLGVVVIVVAVVLWLVFTPSQLTKIVNKVAGDYVLAETHFDRVDLTLFKTFPDAGLKIDNVYIVNPTEGAASDTVARIGSLTLGVDVKAFMKEKKVIVHQVIVEDVQANLFIGDEGKSNFDIFPKGEEDTTTSAFSLDSLPEMDLRKVKVSHLDASFDNRQGGMRAEVEGLALDIVGKLKEGRVDADLDLGTDRIALVTHDSTGATSLDAMLEDLALALKAKGDLDAVDGKLKLKVENSKLMAGGTEMVNETLQASKKDLLKVEMPFKADIGNGLWSVTDGALQIDKYALYIDGLVKTGDEGAPMQVDVKLHNTSDPWQVEPLLEIIPNEYMEWKKGMDLDGTVAFAAAAVGDLGEGKMPLIRASATIDKGRFHYPKAVPYKVNGIDADLEAVLDLNEGGVSNATVNSLKAHTQGTDISLKGTVDDLLGDMSIGANLKGNLPLTDLKPLLPDSLKLTAAGKADVDLTTDFKLSQITKQEFAKIVADATIKFKNLDVTLDSLHAAAPTLDVALQLPAKKHKGKMGDVHVTGSKLKVQTGNIDATLDKPDIDAGLNDITKEQLAASFDIAVGETEANIDSMMVSLEGLQLKGNMRLDSTQANVIRQYNPVADLNLHGAVLYMPQLPDAVRLSQLSLAYTPKGANIRGVEVKLGHSDFQLYGTVDNLEQWLDHKEILHADLNFTSGYADIDQLISLISGIGSDADTLEQMREEDEVPAEANPFIVPKDVDLTLHTHIKRSVAFGNDLNDVAGAVTIKDGTAILDQIGFVCKAATMQLTALYRSPRPNNLFVALDFHLLDIQIDELIDMIPTIDTLVPMLAAFNGNANFHLAAETFLDARYQPKMSSLLGSAAISGRDLTVMDNNSIAQIAKLMQIKNWKDKDNKIRIDSLDVEMTCFRKEIEVFPFLLNIGKYQICASGKHTLDNQCGYHVELLKNPLLAKVGVDVRGNLSSPKITLGEVRYADLYRPDKQGVVEKQTLELKRKIKEALEANVR